MQLINTLVCLLCLLGCKSADADGDMLIQSVGQGQVAFESERIGELSGIVRLGGDNYVVVSDHRGGFALATIRIDPDTGHITEASIDQTGTLEGGGDIEDVAFDSNCMLVVVDEETQAASLHHPIDGGRVERGLDMPVPAVPAVYQQARPNLGLESIAAGEPPSGTVWIANEEALSADGPTSSEDEGTLVRLQRFSEGSVPTAQYAYRTDPHRGADNLAERGFSGVVGLVALPGGGLIVMERELGGSFIPTIRIRLYLVDTADATDTTERATLLDEDIVPVDKRLLFELDAGYTNFEGITIGPRLSNGRRHTDPRRR